MHNPIEWVTKLLKLEEIKSSNCFDNLRLLEGLLYYRFSKGSVERGKIIKIFQDLSSSAKDSFIKNFSHVMSQAVNIENNIYKYVSKYGIENFDKGMKKINDIYRIRN